LVVVPRRTGRLTVSRNVTLTLTKSNLYFDSSLKTLIRYPTLYKLLTFHVPNLISTFLLLGHLSMEFIHVQCCFVHFIRSLFFSVKCKPHTQHPNWRTTPCRLSADAYSVYLQLPSIAGCRCSIRNLRTSHAVVTVTRRT
jgi:hypothetical protein